MTNLLILIILFCILGFIFGCTKPKKETGSIGGNYDDTKMKSLINPPKKPSFLLRQMIKIADKKAGKKMLPGRVLSWSPDIAISSGVLELYIEKGAAKCLDKRLIKLLRVVVSYAVPSQFTLDINLWKYKDFSITEEEIMALQDVKKIDSTNSFSKKEKTALKYSYALSKTPIVLNQKLLDDLRSLFSEKEIVAIASLTAKVNYWARLVEGLRIKPAGYTDDSILNIKDYNTFKK